MISIRRFTALLLAAALAAALMTPALAAGTVKKVQVAMGTGVADAPEAQVEIAWDDGWFFRKAAAYQHPLALAAMALSGAAYVESDRGPAAADALEALGFTSIKSWHYQAAPEDGRDLAAYTFAIKTLRSGNKSATLVAVVIRGTGDAAQWASNLDMGSGSDHAGFSRTAGELAENLDAYLREADLSPAKVRFLITGHSRGGAAANLLSARLMAAGAEKSRLFAYTFAAPAVSVNAREKGYENIFNIIQLEDLVTQIPLAAWGYRRYGVDLRLPGSGDRDSELYQKMDRQYKALTGQSYAPFQDSGAVANTLADIERMLPDLSDAGRAMLSSLFQDPEGDWAAYLRRNSRAALTLGRTALAMSAKVTGLLRREGNAIVSAHCMAGYYSWLAACETAKEAEGMFAAFS